MDLNLENLPANLEEVFSVPDASAAEIRDRIEIMEEIVGSAPQLKLEPKHYFADGLYARELFIPKGTVLTGAIHKTEHINVCTMGDITVLTESGLKRIKAPFTMVSTPGTKRVGYAHEDTVWITFHATEETDIDKIEETLTAKTHEEFEAFIEERSKCLLP